MQPHRGAELRSAEIHELPLDPDPVLSREADALDQPVTAGGVLAHLDDPAVMRAENGDLPRQGFLQFIEEHLVRPAFDFPDADAEHAERPIRILPEGNRLFELLRESECGKARNLLDDRPDVDQVLRDGLRFAPGEPARAGKAAVMRFPPDFGRVQHRDIRLRRAEHDLFAFAPGRTASRQGGEKEPAEDQSVQSHRITSGIG